MEHVEKTVKVVASYRAFDDVALIYPEGISHGLYWYVVTREYFDKMTQVEGSCDWIISHVPPDSERFTIISQHEFDRYKEGFVEAEVGVPIVVCPESLLADGNLHLVVQDNRLMDATIVDLNGEVVPRAYIFKVPVTKANEETLQKTLDELCASGKLKILYKGKTFIDYKFYADKEDMDNLLVRNGNLYKPITLFSLGRYLKIL